MPAASRASPGERLGWEEGAYLCEGVESVASVISAASAQAAASDATSALGPVDRVN